MSWNYPAGTLVVLIFDTDEGGEHVVLTRTVGPPLENDEGTPVVALEGLDNFYECDSLYAIDEVRAFVGVTMRGEPVAANELGAEDCVACKQLAKAVCVLQHVVRRQTPPTAANDGGPIDSNTN